VTTDAAPIRAPRDPRKLTIVAALLVCHLGLLLACAFNKSACFDEGAHLTAGLAYLRHAEMSMYNLSPPLLRMWAAIPADLGGADLLPAKPMRDYSASARHWIYFRQFQRLPDNQPRLHQFILWGRLMLIPFSLAGAALVLCWAWRLYGFAAGAIACAAWSFSPLIIASGSTLGTDMPTAVMMLAACGAWARFLRTLRNRDAILAGVAIAAAIAMKFTAVLLLPPLLILAILAAWRSRARIKPIVAGAVLVLVLSFVILNLTYGFKFLGKRIDSFNFRSDTMQMIQRTLPASTPIPLPRDLIEGFDAQTYEVQMGFPTTLFGEGYLFNDWRYYPWSIATKTTLGGLLLLVLGAASFFWRRPSEGELTLLVFLVCVGGAIVLGGNINVGLRYLLPVYPAAIILMARSLTIPSLRLIAIAAAVGIAAESLSAAPRYQAFCNLAARPWKRLVPDLDWGQSLIDLRRWMLANGQTRISTVYFGSADPITYGVVAPDPIDQPLTPYIAISRKAISGLPVRTPDGFVFVRCWKSLQDTAPVVDLGGMLIYRAADITSAPAQPPIVRIADWQAVIDDPALIPFRDRQVIEDRIAATTRPADP
jgi:hypothetical protein